MTTIAVYPGTFDPVTNGHLDLAERGRNHFDRLIIGVLSNEGKEPLFEVQERVDLLRAAVDGWENVEVEAFDGLLVDFARRVGASLIVRGIRAVTDLEYEMQMAMMNLRQVIFVSDIYAFPIN